MNKQDYEQLLRDRYFLDSAKILYERLARNIVAHADEGPNYRSIEVFKSEQYMIISRFLWVIVAHTIDSLWLFMDTEIDPDPTKIPEFYPAEAEESHAKGL